MVVLTPLALVEGAEADCTPVSPVIDTIVTCTGTTTNQNDPNGFGTATDTGNTINVQPGAVVTGQQFGIEAASTTVNNNGRIESTNAIGAAVHAATADVTNNNNGVIRSPSFGVQTSGAANITNSGTIESTARIAILAGSANIDNSGTISSCRRKRLVDAGPRHCEKLGLFVGGSNAILSTGGIIEVTDNTGTIRATDAAGHAIKAETVAAVTNSAGGVIEANGLSGIAIQAGTLAAVTNAGLISGVGHFGQCNQRGDSRCNQLRHYYRAWRRRDLQRYGRYVYHKFRYDNWRSGRRVCCRDIGCLQCSYGHATSDERARPKCFYDCRI